MPEKENRLAIVAVTHQVNPQAIKSREIVARRKGRREEMQAKFERLWFLNPQQFDPSCNCMERERVERTIALIATHIDPAAKHVVDLGCGNGLFVERLSQEGALIDAVDIASNALKFVQKKALQNVKIIQDYLPKTALRDNTYDLALSTEVIAHLYAEDHRLFFAELARVIKPSGHIVCSTPLDINSEDALQRFSALAETEFTIVQWIFSYHYLHIRMQDFIDAPARFIRARSDSEYRQQQLRKRSALKRLWFMWNTTLPMAKLWAIGNYLLKPIARVIKQNRSILIGLEKVCHFIWSSSGISHAIFIGTRRPLQEELPTADLHQQERKQKKQIWE